MVDSQYVQGWMIDGNYAEINRTVGVVMSGKWDHVISQADNLIWTAVAVGIYVLGKYLDVPELYAISGAALVKIKGENGGKP